MILPRDSIRARLIGLAMALTGVALVAGYLAIAAILEDFIADRFDAETGAVADTLIAGAGIDERGRLTAGPAPSDPRFQIPLSGWFWQLAQDGRVVAKSPSLFDNVLNPPDGNFSGGPGIGPDGALLRVTHYRFTLPDSDRTLSVTVTAPQSEIDGSMARLRRPLAISLAVLGLSLALASFAQVAAGLR
ncbi:MAG: sensor histidine kinase, partial [Paracoccus sp.]|nr:sensor histidine kinase [Paracoccus sp. (in: a-proteobacteria)]